jgi:hypothetical protein
LFGVCLFFGGFWRFEKSRSPAQQKNFWREDLGWTLYYNIADVLDEVMDLYSNDDALPNIGDHVFEEDYKYNDNENDDDGFAIDSTDTRLCLSDLLNLGWSEIEKSNVKELRHHTDKQYTRKQDATKYIMQQVMDLKRKMKTMSVCSKNPSPELSSWSCYLHEL